MARRIARLAESLQGSTDYPASFNVDPDDVTAALLVGGRRYQTGELLSLCRRSPITLPMGMIPTYPEFPLAPWESPGGQKAAFDPTPDASLSIVQGWDNFAVVGVTDGAGAMAALELVAAPGAAERIQIGFLNTYNRFAVENVPFYIASGTTGTNYFAGVAYHIASVWSGALVDVGESLVVEAIAGQTAAKNISVNGTYRIVKS